MERASPVNILQAFKQVKRNSGSEGVDKMSVKELGIWLQNNLQLLQTSLLKGEYKPQPVRGVKIPKAKGGYRQLGIPTVIDRIVQQDIAQVLQVIYEPSFSPRSYGFRPKRNAHQALQKSAEIVKIKSAIIKYSIG